MGAEDRRLKIQSLKGEGVLQKPGMGRGGRVRGAFGLRVKKDVNRGGRAGGIACCLVRGGGGEDGVKNVCACYVKPKTF